MQPLVNIQGNIIDLSKILFIKPIETYTSSPDADDPWNDLIGFDIISFEKKKIKIKLDLDSWEEDDPRNQETIKMINSLRNQLIEAWANFKTHGSDVIIPEIKPKDAQTT